MIIIMIESDKYKSYNIIDEESNDIQTYFDYELIEDYLDLASIKILVKIYIQRQMCKGKDNTLNQVQEMNANLK